MHPKGLNFANQRKVVILRDVHDETWEDIAKKVKNLQGDAPNAQTVTNVYKAFSTRGGRVKTKYKNCGRQAWKATPEVEKFLLKRLRELRCQCVCTSTTLQLVLAREKKVKLSTSYIRKLLVKHGYKWLRRSQKRKYDANTRAQRIAFAKQVLKMSAAQLRERLAFAMDGVILTMPPRDPTNRWNYCHYGEDHLWRLPSEACSPKLAGDDPYGKQVPLARAIPMWGGVSAGGFSVVVFHKTKKLTAEEWCTAVKQGKLRDAIKKLKPTLRFGPWWVLCDNEGFLRARASTRLYQRIKVKLWKIPKLSPDCNPVEKFWGWVRARLRAMDLRDACAKRPCLGKMAYRRHVRRLCSSKRAQTVAANCARGLKKVCKEILLKKGAATRG